MPVWMLCTYNTVLCGLVWCVLAGCLNACRVCKLCTCFVSWCVCVCVCEGGCESGWVDHYGYCIECVCVRIVVEFAHAHTNKTMCTGMELQQNCRACHTFSEFHLVISSSLSRRIHGDTLLTTRLFQSSLLRTMSLRVSGPGRSRLERKNSRL